MQFKRILLKISGESLADSNSIYGKHNIQKVTKQIQKVQKEFPELQIVIVIGGGNIWRGKQANNLNIYRHNADYIGMLATVMNGLCLKDELSTLKINAELFTSFFIDKIGTEYKIDTALKALEAKKMVICAGGTGSPFFTTDTTAALRACELNCDAIFMAKNLVDGVYDADPRKNKNAKFLSYLTFEECISKKLEIMDLTAFSMCLANNLKVIVFNASIEDSFIKVLNDKIKYTVIK